MVSGQSHHIRFDGEKICVRPNSNRYISTDGDGIHIIQSNGYIIIENCDFSAMGDDDVNIHDCHFFVDKKLDEKSILFKNEAYGQKGDIIKIHRCDFSPLSEKLTIDKIEPLENHRTIVYFNEKIPEEIKEGYMLVNKSFGSNYYIIRNNYFHENRARGLLLQCSNGLVENNRFYRTEGAAIFIMLEALVGLWYEGSGVDGLVIRNNTFTDVNCGDWTSCLDMISNIPDKTSDYAPFRNIEIYNNTFKNCSDPVMILEHGSNITVKDNFIDSGVTEKTFKISKCENINVN